jgi:predicted ATPase
MEGKRTINSIKLKNILSFGSEGLEIELQPLNVLIGPNASGKSNFIEVFRLLRALQSNPPQSIREGGGISEWLWKGGGPLPIAEIDLQFSEIFPGQGAYHLQFSKLAYQLQITLEQLDVESPYKRVTRKPSYSPEMSILSLHQSDEPEANALGNMLSSIGIYKDWNSGRYSPIRSPQRPDLPGHPLREDLSNFGLLLNNLPSRTKQQISEQLKQVYEGIEEVITQINGGYVLTYLQEKGLSSPTPIDRVSDGTLRYLFLLLLLKQPDLPPILCIEEPELGLHTDVIHLIADLLVETSQRTQLIVTTHSDVLVSALSRHPEAILVCERFDSGTELTRLDPEQWKLWLEEYSLGDLWRRGDLGGTRW